MEKIVEGHRCTQEPLQSVMSVLDEQLHEMKKRRFSPKTRSSHRHATCRFLNWITVRGRQRLQDITASDLEAYRLELQSRNYSPHTLELYVRAVDAFFKYLEQTQRIFINPASALPPLRLTFPLQPVPSVAEIRKLLAVPDTTTPMGVQDRAILETLYSTGARLGELKNMTVLDPDLEHGMIRLAGKGNKHRMAPLGKQAVFWLKVWLRDVRPKHMQNHPEKLSLWVGSHHRKPLNTEIIERKLRHYAKAAGIKMQITPHAMRRACATHMLENGAHPVQIQMLLGHSDLSSLSQYLRVTVKAMRKMHQNSRLGK